MPTPCWKVFCHLRTDDEGWYWQLYFGSKLTIFHYYVIRCHLIELILYIFMTTSVSRRLNILCIMFKVIEFFIITQFARLYVRVGILENTERAIKNGQSRKTGNIWYTRKTKQKQSQHNICWIPLNANNVNKTRTLLQKQLEVKTNQTSFLCGNPCN